MIEFNGREYASTDDMPIKVRAAYDRAMAEKPELHSGARLAAKLNAKIIMNGSEFNHAGEMSVDDRHLYHEALEALFTPDIAVSTQTNGEKHSPIMRAVRNVYRKPRDFFA